jgi:microcystin degradation protein MlrC
VRIAIGEIAHETNTFRPGVTGTEQFKALEWQQGTQILENHRGVRDYLGGMIAAGDTLDIELVPTFAASAEPSATIAREAFDTMRDALLAELRAVDPVDAICLSLHGAGTAEGIDDVEGALLAAVREVVGATVPLVVTLDLHGHLTPAMVEHADLLLNCHEYPHVDCYERGMEAVELAARLVRGEIRPHMHAETLPMMLPPTTTMEGPGREITATCLEWEARPGMIDCALVHGFPHTDVPIMGTSVLATADGDPDLAREAAQAVAAQLWDRREDFRQNLPGVDEAVRLALESSVVPVVIAEVSDNSGGGAPADGTHLLRALLAANVPGTCFGFLTDPAVAQQAHEAGVGATIAVRLGGKSDDLHGAPIAATAYIKCLTDGRFRYTTPMGAGAEENLGPMARLVIGNVDVLVASIRSQTLDAEVFLLHGIDVSRARIVALKSTQHFRAGFAHLAGLIIRTDPPGATTSNLAHLPYRRVRRPIWPLDEAVTWAPMNDAQGKAAPPARKR